ncbi:nitrogenase molybdenum-iron protein alpha chain [Ruminiclostridium sufflavum DSM 19573]|uniref:Nitrogenase protein alpha chain n=1 Tax=Ruminiclostridium sufflavum DSM 19573 TaxID=1121337 RepID=A0A318XG29_9FIRM|nr:nitrogenase component I subunit alpha [Ruminiclostridium sufflavum]PYG84821.1 nitrogenase molybdenum-iron protein alpha chain [Ruminiclostridium sufflavum DSM 19573]
MNVRNIVLDKYSAKVYKNRKEHIIEVNEETRQQPIAANTRSVPGIMTNRGCCYAGCKGVVLGPLKDVLVLTHGPIGCGFYSWGTRRNKAKPEDGRNFIEYCFSTDLQESDIVFGGEKKLRQAIKEAVEIFNPKCIMICSTCPVGLIGDDIHAVASDTEREYGISCMAFSCEGYKGVSQSGGHHIANNTLIRKVIGTGDAEPTKRFTINMLGEYNIGGDGWEVERLLKRIGYEIITVFTGDGSYETMKNAHMANLNIVQCHRSINYIAEMMKTKYGVDWIKVNFIGLEAIIQSLRDMATYFGDNELTERTEAVILDELANIAEEKEYYYSKLKGKTAALYVGGSRSHHYQNLLADFGVKTVLAGYEFAHRDDYEGREVIPTIKEDADSKNIEHLEVKKDERKFHAYLTEEQYEELKTKIPLEQYCGMIRTMEDNSVVVDDLNHFETEEFIKLLKPDMFFSGIKDKYVLQKSGVYSKQLHSYDYSGPYAGFLGAINFARDLTMGLYTPAWGLVIPPWKNKSTLKAKLAGGEK